MKELVQEGLRTKALILREEEKKATTNMVSIRFGALQPVSIPKRWILWTPKFGSSLMTQKR
jgi:hypothetical protein